MKLREVSITNFRSIKQLAFRFPDDNLLVLVGPNNAGKSNIIRAIDAICGEGWFGRDKMEDHDFYQRDRRTPFKITLTFDNGSSAELSSAERWTSYRDRNGRPIYQSQGNIKDDFPCTYLGADRTFDKHLAFYDWTLIGKIRKRFHQRALPLQGELQDKFEELTSIFDRVVGFQKFKSDFSNFFSEMQADTSAHLDITFKPFTPSNYFKAMQILASDPGQSETPLDLEELGEGSRNTVLIALLRSYAMNFRNTPEGVSGILALEEPEIFLHPQARRHLYKVLRSIAAAGVQVVISTHSASFIDTEHFDSIGQVSKVPDEERPGCSHTHLQLVTREQLRDHCVRTGVPSTKVTTANITEFYRTTSNYRLNEAFFAKYVILVEGDTEEQALPEYLRAAGIDCDLQGISMIAVDGKNQIPKYWRLFGLFTSNILCMFDDDSETEAKAGSNANLCRCFGIMFSAAVGTATFQSFDATTGPKTPVIALRQDFEAAIKMDFLNRYPEGAGVIAGYEAAAKELIKPVRDQNKGQVARYVARRLSAEYPDFVPGFVEQIAAILRDALGLTVHDPAAEACPLDALQVTEDDDCPF
jgi:putative ATP-dependent endonuclease of OLD family